MQIIRVFPRPTSESSYLKGILRNVNVSVYETDHYVTGIFENAGVSIIGNNYSLYWHSIYDEKYTQYVEITLKNHLALVNAYMFSSGYNFNGYDLYLPANWNLECSLNNQKWYVLKEHINSTDFDNVEQKKVYDIDEPHLCKSFRIHGTGPDDRGRPYMYAGPIELFGILYQIPTVNQKIFGFDQSFLFTLTSIIN